MGSPSQPSFHAADSGLELRRMPPSLHELSTASCEGALAAARSLLLDYGRFVASQPSVATFCYGKLQEEADNLPQSYLSQGGGAIVAASSHNWLGFIAWRALAPPELAAWELKRLWIDPKGWGWGKASFRQ